MRLLPPDCDSCPGDSEQIISDSEGGSDDGVSPTAAGSGRSGTPAPPSNPQAILAGRSAGGFGLEWNPVEPWLLLGADLQGGVQLWDVEAYSSGSSSGSGSGSRGGGPLSGRRSCSRMQPLQVRAGQ